MSTSFNINAIQKDNSNKKIVGPNFKNKTLFYQKKLNMQGLFNHATVHTVSQ